MAQLGLTLPLRRGPLGYFESTSDILTQVKSNLINLLLTVKGERVFQPNFGWDGHRYLFEPITDDTMSELQASIEEAVGTWLPYLRVDATDVKKEEDFNTVNLTVTFTLLTNTTMQDSVVLVF